MVDSSPLIVGRYLLRAIICLLLLNREERKHGQWAYNSTRIPDMQSR